MTPIEQRLLRAWHYGTFGKNVRWRSDTRVGDVSTEALPSIEIRHDGDRLVACDPHALASAPPMARALPASTWRVSRIDQRLRRIGWRTAAVVASLRSKTAEPAWRSGVQPPVRWERASFTSGADAFGVDYAMATLTSESFATHVREDERLRARVISAVDGAPPGKVDLVASGSDGRKRRHSFFWFQSGMGDGLYSAWWGLSAQEEAVSVVIDFEILPNE